jgi:hypothetical protein
LTGFFAVFFAMRLFFAFVFLATFFLALAFFFAETLLLAFLAFFLVVVFTGFFVFFFAAFLAALALAFALVFLTFAIGLIPSSQLGPGLLIVAALSEMNSQIGNTSMVQGDNEKRAWRQARIVH